LQTIFATPFFSLTAPEQGLLPIFGNAAYSWVYFVVVGVISVVVFTWWGYKHHELRSQGARPSTTENADVEEVDTDEVSVSAQNSSRVARNKLQAAIIRQEALNELEEMKKTEPGEDEDEELRRAWDEKQGLAFTKLLLAQRAMETGEDIASILASVEDRNENNE
jgi:hypothetical protein